MNTTKRITLLIAALALAGVGCTKKDDTAASSATYSAEKPSGLMGAVATAVSKAGGGITSTTTSSTSVTPFIASTDCDTHGDPLTASVPNSSDPKYPGYLTYCKLTTDDKSPDTVQGTFTGTKSIACAMEKAGVTYDGTARSATLTLDTTCFTEAQLTDMGGATTMSVTLTGSSPASFNTYFDRGVIAEVTGFGTYKFASKVTASKIEFATYEEQSATKLGTTFGSLDLTTGDLRAEARMQRIDCTTSGSCGWNRHWRIYAAMNISGGVVGEPKSISFAYSNIQAPPGQSGYYGILVTASGDKTLGFKARAFTATASAIGHYYTAGNWAEVTNTKCYLAGSETATTCGTGIAGFTGTPNFVLNSTGSSSGTTPGSFFTGFAGATFTSVDPNTDVQ